jgi:hypothetical protein
VITWTVNTTAAVSTSVSGSNSSTHSRSVTGTYLSNTGSGPSQTKTNSFFTQGSSSSSFSSVTSNGTTLATNYSTTFLSTSQFAFDVAAGNQTNTSGRTINSTTASVNVQTTTASTREYTFYPTTLASVATSGWSYDSEQSLFTATAGEVSSITLATFTQSSQETFITTTNSGTASDGGHRQTHYRADRFTRPVFVNGVEIAQTQHEVLWAANAPASEPLDVAGYPASESATTATSFVQNPPSQTMALVSTSASTTPVSKTITTSKYTVTFDEADPAAPLATFTVGTIAGYQLPIVTDVVQRATATKSASSSYGIGPSESFVLTQNSWSTGTRWLTSVETYSGFYRTSTIRERRGLYVSTTENRSAVNSVLVSSTSISDRTLDGNTTNYSSSASEIAGGGAAFSAVPIVWQTERALGTGRFVFEEIGDAATSLFFYGKGNFVVNGQTGAAITGLPECDLVFNDEQPNPIWAKVHRNEGFALTARPGTYDLDPSGQSFTAGKLSVSGNSFTSSTNDSVTSGSASGSFGLSHPALENAGRAIAQDFAGFPNIEGRAAGGSPSPDETVVGATRQGAYRVYFPSAPATTTYFSRQIKTSATGELAISALEALSYFVPQTNLADTSPVGQTMTVWPVARNANSQFSAW